MSNMGIKANTCTHKLFRDAYISGEACLLWEDGEYVALSGSIRQGIAAQRIADRARAERLDDCNIAVRPSMGYMVGQCRRGHIHGRIAVNMPAEFVATFHRAREAAYARKSEVYQHVLYGGHLPPLARVVTGLDARHVGRHGGSR